MPVLVPSRQRCREGGDYYVVKSPTPGTGIATATAPTGYSATASFLVCKNQDALLGGKSIIPDYLKLINTAPGTAGASTHLTLLLENDQVGTLYTSGGSVLAGTGSSPGALGLSSRQGSNGIARVLAGALVTVAAPESRKVSENVFRVVIPVAGDVYEVVFGVDDLAGSGSVLNGTTPAHIVHRAPGVEVGPQWALRGSLWLPSQSAASSWEIEFAYWELQVA